MCEKKFLRAQRYPDRFLRDLARRLNHVLALAKHYHEPARFLEDLLRILRTQEPRRKKHGS